ncbi:sensor histidine kinase [Streptosporangium sp. NBC_01469]|uniref:sensor histidine kinase n=1 Tax=Streptosporangium sp. NBC_01469 TaxID=2903898 RepID=UPI002E2A460D|nr:sensor histidine kinase [Streptosporangium sp. NBC_01469]
MYHSAALAALRNSPVRFWFTRWPWTSLAYLAIGAMLWVFTLMAFALIGTIPYWARWIATVERRWVRLAGFRPIPGRPPGAGVPDLQEPVLWREIAFALAHMLIGAFSSVALITGTAMVFAAIVAVFVLAGVDTPLLPNPSQAPFLALVGLLIVVASPYAVTLAAYVQGALATALLSPRVEELQTQVASLARANIAELDRFEGERQRIERDLHDGTQQHLATSAMRLGMLELEVRETFPPGPEQDSALESLEAVRRENELALDTLRDVVHGLRPRTLIDDGLGAALRELARRVPINTTVDAEGVGRFALPVESSLYYIASEAVTNAIKHATPDHIHIELAQSHDRITLTVSDNGLGGANSAHGTGMVGMYERAALLSGELIVDSPPGGPTGIIADIPRPY